MNIAILGTGMVGQAFASRLQALGHTVTIGTRNVADTLAKTDNDGMGNPPFPVWHKSNNTVLLKTFAEAVSGAEAIFNCTKGDAVMKVLESIGTEPLSGKLFIDISNPLDFSNGFPPTLSVCNTSSLGEEIQKAYPALNVVKSMNTMTVGIMVNPALVQGNHTVFMSGNNAEAKAKTATFLQSFGWQERNIIDLGDITTARGTEMLLPVWVRLFAKLQTPMFNFHINIQQAV